MYNLTVNYVMLMHGIITNEYVNHKVKRLGERHIFIIGDHFFIVLTGKNVRQVLSPDHKTQIL